MANRTSFRWNWVHAARKYAKKPGRCRNNAPFAGTVAQMQSLAFNNDACAACLLQQLRKDFPVEMQRVAITSFSFQVLHTRRRVAD
jgi:hypothetical protein